MELRIPKQRLALIIIIAFILGLVANWIIIGNPGNNAERSQSFFFIFFIPITSLLFIGFLHLIKLENKLIIAIMNAVWFAIALILMAFILVLLTGGNLSGEVGMGLGLFVGVFFLPAIILGFLFGLFIAYSLRKTEKIREDKTKHEYIVKNIRNYIIAGAIAGLFFGLFNPLRIYIPIPFFNSITNIIIGSFIGLLFYLMDKKDLKYNASIKGGFFGLLLALIISSFCHGAGCSPYIRDTFLIQILFYSLIGVLIGFVISKRKKFYSR